MVGRTVGRTPSAPSPLSPLSTCCDAAAAAAAAVQGGSSAARTD